MSPLDPVARGAASDRVRADEVPRWNDTLRQRSACSCRPSASCAAAQLTGRMCRDQRWLGCSAGRRPCCGPRDRWIEAAVLHAPVPARQPVERCCCRATAPQPGLARACVGEDRRLAPATPTGSSATRPPFAGGCDPLRFREDLLPRRSKTGSRCRRYPRLRAPQLPRAPKTVSSTPSATRAGMSGRGATPPPASDLNRIP